MSDSIYTQANRIFDGAGALVQPGGEVKLPSQLRVPHVAIDDTELAACLGTLDVPFRQPGPYTDDVGLDSGGNERGRRKVWWMADCSSSRKDDKEQFETTDFIASAYAQRAKFEAEFPLHPLVAMRAGIDARRWWILCTQAYRAGQARIPTEAQGPHCVTGSLHAASLLKACGFEPLAFTGKAFVLAATHNGLHAEELLISAAREGGTPQHWIATVLFNLGHMLKKVKEDSATILREAHDDNQTLILSAESTGKTRDKFYSLLK